MPSSPMSSSSYTRRHIPTEAEAVVFGGNGFRVVGVIAALERELDRPVVSPNQALLWGAMRAAGARTDSITRYGRPLRDRVMQRVTGPANDRIDAAGLKGGLAVYLG